MYLCSSESTEVVKKLQELKGSPQSEVIDLLDIDQASRGPHQSTGILMCKSHYKVQSLLI